jgi:hypothetical protein
VARWKTARLIGLTALRLVLPVILTLVLLGASYLYADAVFPLFGAPQAIRGPRWWTAPLAGSFAASLVFSAIYYPAAYAGVYERWTDSAAVHFVVFFGMSVLLLAPYWLLRPAMRPMPGLNGY